MSTWHLLRDASEQPNEKCIKMKIFSNFFNYGSFLCAVSLINFYWKVRAGVEFTMSRGILRFTPPSKRTRNGRTLIKVLKLMSLFPFIPTISFFKTWWKIHQWFETSLNFVALLSFKSFLKVFKTPFKLLSNKSF